MGVLLGIPLAITSRVGSRPKLYIHDLIRPIVVLLAAMAGCAVISGVIGYIWGQDSASNLAAVSLPPDLDRRFAADLWAHSASYLCGFLGGLILCVVTYRKRARLSRNVHERTDAIAGMMKWPRSTGVQAAIAFAVALLSAVLVFLQIAMESINQFYFPQAYQHPYPDAHSADIALYQDCGLAFLGVFVLLYAVQRRITAKRRS